MPIFKYHYYYLIYIFLQAWSQDSWNVHFFHRLSQITLKKALLSPFSDRVTKALVRGEDICQKSGKLII